MKQALIHRLKGRGKGVRLNLPFDDIMEFAIALLTVGPEDLEALGWTFADRKRFLDHFLASGRAAQGVAPEHLGQKSIEIVVPRKDLDRLHRFAVRELPKAASNAAMLDRVIRALDQAARRQDAGKRRTAGKS
ncbi:hypothetical protein ACLIMP_25640 (plasmid) [Novosphingobium aerophilum]|jgi:hypothetical protein|uniref:hypothetical protein n=1 Tax=Sphingomonadales TaxID=204457 RepID=UPI0019CD0558|nr:hypothetical protein [Rhizorhabdus sp.]MBD3761358.1 hypothetical protein [Rhizorhabdus sp.]